MIFTRQILEELFILIDQVFPFSVPGQFLGTGKVAYDGKTTVLSAWGISSFDVGTWWG